MKYVVRSHREPLVSKYAGDYCYGDSVTLADINLFPQVGPFTAS